jgi:4-hydroxybenzoate polyprenyltransferase
MKKKLWNILDLIRLNTLTRHTGYMLIFLPCVMGIGLYGNIDDHYGMLLLFFIGSIIMRGAGCIINDILDRDIDKQVERTKNRPIADGRVTVTEGAMTFIFMSLIGLWILTQFASEAIIVGIVGMILLITYPTMKRITFWPQVYLGFAFNIGILVAAADLTHSITFETILMYIGCIFWTMHYDTIYAFADIEDDKKIGIKSLAIFLENKDYKMWMSGFAVAANIFLFFSMLMTSHDMPAVSYCLLLTTVLMLYQIKHLDIQDPKKCIEQFNLNVYIGIIWSLMSLMTR